MKRIVLACGAGMSTSMLASKMTKEAKIQNLDVVVEAIPIAKIDDTIKEEKVDVLLLGPQVRYMEKDISELLKPMGIPHAMIPMQDYGLMNGKKVLEDAMKLINEE